MVLIVGCQGIIGSQLFKHFSRKSPGHLVGLSHKPPEDGAKNVFRFDLFDPDWSVLDRIPEGTGHAVLCSAIHSLDACYQDPEGTQLFNVTHMCHLIERLLEREIVPVFLSSASVFDGERGPYDEDDQTIPISVYGSQKRKVEESLARFTKKYLILRLNKVVGFDTQSNSFLKEWTNKLRVRESIKAADDQILSVTDIYDVIEAVDFFTSSNISGTFHISSEEYLTRYEMARRLAEVIGASPNLIQRCSLKDFQFLEKRPSNETLISKKYLDLSRRVFKSFDKYLELLNFNGNS